MQVPTGYVLPFFKIVILEVLQSDIQVSQFITIYFDFCLPFLTQWEKVESHISRDFILSHISKKHAHHISFGLSDSSLRYCLEKG